LIEADFFRLQNRSGLLFQPFDHAAHLGRIAEQFRRPGVHVRLGVGANRVSGRGPLGRRRRLAAEQRHQPVRQRNAGARRPHDLELRRGRSPPAMDSTVLQRARIAAHDLINTFGHQRIADRVDGISQGDELRFQDSLGGEEIG